MRYSVRWERCADCPELPPAWTVRDANGFAVACTSSWHEAIRLANERAVA